MRGCAWFIGCYSSRSRLRLRRHEDCKAASGFGGRLTQDLFHDVAVDVGEAVVAALEAVRQLRVVEPEAVHERRLQVVDVDHVLRHLEPEVVALADSRFLFCDNDISDALFEMRLTKTGALSGRLIRHEISGVSPRYFDDFESMAIIGGGEQYRIVIATSFSLKIRDAHARKKAMPT